MNALLDLPEARERVLRWSVKDYERFTELGVFGKNVELIRGFVVQKMSKSPLHRFTAKVLYDFLAAHLPADCFVMFEAPLRLIDSLPEPDLTVVRGKQSSYRDRHPSTAELVVEVAVSSATLDRENAGLYAEAGVAEYWIVLASRRQVEIYRQPDPSGYQMKFVADFSTILECASVPEIRVNWADLLPEA